MPRRMRRSQRLRLRQEERPQPPAEARERFARRSGASRREADAGIPVAYVADGQFARLAGDRFVACESERIAAFPLPGLPFVGTLMLGMKVASVEVAMRPRPHYRLHLEGEGNGGGE